MLLGNAKLLSYNLPIKIHLVKVITIEESLIYLIGGLIVLFTDLSLKLYGGVGSVLFKEAVEVGIIFKIQCGCYFLHRVLAPE